MKQQIETIGGHWYWAVLGANHVLECVQSEPDNSGFYCGDETFPWSQAIVIAEAIPPSTAMIQLAIAKTK
jgi:hypothetical protein